jgi:phosphoribosylaminoimidazolecarboxamide formyltransferase/IMP cyclohydrolase
MGIQMSGEGLLRIERALVSVSDKTGVVDLVRALREQGAEVLSPGGTAAALRKAGLDVVDVGAYTGFPEMLDGRVKTLHPKIAAGILARRDLPDHEQQMREHGLGHIDCVAVNLYPFEATVAKGAPLDECIEQIDIGGPTMVRAAAKNHGSVAILTSASDYPAFIDEMRRNGGAVGLKTRERLAAAAFAHTAAYDAAISTYLERNLIGADEPFPPFLTVRYTRRQSLRYGENPHQRAAFYVEPTVKEACLANAKQHQGKELSFNNILDADSGLRLVQEFDETAVVVLKHNNPCGVGIGETQIQAYERAHSTDPKSAFGGVIILNRPCTVEVAKAVMSTFNELVLAPGFEQGALEAFKKSKNLRLLELPALGKEHDARYSMKHVVGGMLVQDRNLKVFGPDFKVVSKVQPTEAQLDGLRFAMKVCKHVKSNCICYTNSVETIGIGAGQMSRVDSAKIGVMKAQEAGKEVRGSCMASDAFFPFRDGIDAAASAGVAAVIQPGGSIRDAEVIAAADEHGMAMVFSGMRHFNH